MHLAYVCKQQLRTRSMPPGLQKTQVRDLSVC